MEYLGFMVTYDDENQDRYFMLLLLELGVD